MSAVLTNITSFFGDLASSARNVIDRFLPPEKRAEVMSKLQGFAISNPKLSAFLLTQIVITGFPLVLFITFTITVFLFSLIAALLVGLLAALLFTALMVAIGLLVVLPTVFLTTMTATFLFLCGLGGYHMVKWVNQGDMPVPEGTAIGDKLNKLSGGRMSWLMDGTRQKHENGPGKKGDDLGETEKRPPKLHDNDQKSNGSPKANINESVPDMQKHHATDGANKVKKQSDGAQRRANKTTGGAMNADDTDDASGR